MLWIRHEICHEDKWELAGQIQLLSLFSTPEGKDHKNIAIGRCSYADIQIDNAGASRWHALITMFRDIKTPIRLVLEDNRSENGTWVNGHRITEPVDLKLGDCINFFNKHRLTLIDSLQENLREEWREGKQGETRKQTVLVNRKGM